MSNTAIRQEPHSSILPSVEDFVEAFSASDQYREFLRTTEVVENDVRAQTLLRQLEQAQQDLQSKKSWGGITPEDIDYLNTLEAELKEYDPAREHIDAQGSLIAFVSAVNEHLSGKLGADFARTAVGHHSCGCGGS